MKPLLPTPPVLRVRSWHSKEDLDLTRDYKDDVIGRSIFKERGDNDDDTYMRYIHVVLSYGKTNTV